VVRTWCRSMRETRGEAPISLFLSPIDAPGRAISRGVVCSYAPRPP
jgi:hypothetical protein